MVGWIPGSQRCHWRAQPKANSRRAQKVTAENLLERFVPAQPPCPFLARLGGAHITVFFTTPKCETEKTPSRCSPPIFLPMV